MVQNYFEIAEEISVPLAIMFNLSLREGTVPPEWKHANVVPIFKKGSMQSRKLQTGKLNISGMRLLESLLRDVDRFSMFDFVRCTQFDVLKGRSC